MGKVFEQIDIRRRGRFFRICLCLAATLTVAHPVEGAPSDELFLTSYEKALHLLTFTTEGGSPLLESSYESLHLFESCLEKELTQRGQQRAAEFLNQKLSSPSFARTYQNYRQSKPQNFNSTDLKMICSALAQR